LAAEENLIFDGKKCWWIFSETVKSTKISFLKVYSVDVDDDFLGKRLLYMMIIESLKTLSDYFFALFERSTLRTQGRSNRECIYILYMEEKLYLLITNKLIRTEIYLFRKLVFTSKSFPLLDVIKRILLSRKRKFNFMQ